MSRATAALARPPPHHGRPGSPSFGPCGFVAPTVPSPYIPSTTSRRLLDDRRIYVRNEEEKCERQAPECA